MTEPIVTGIASLPGAYLQAPMLMECSSYNEMLGLPRMDSTSAAALFVVILAAKHFDGLGKKLKENGKQ